MPAALYGYALMGKPPKNRRRWLGWLIAVMVVLLAAGIPSAVGAVFEWTAVAAGGGDVGQAVGITLFALLLTLMIVVVLVSVRSQWRFHSERDAAAVADAEARE